MFRLCWGLLGTCSIILYNVHECSPRGPGDYDDGNAIHDILYSITGYSVKFKYVRFSTALSNAGRPRPIRVQLNHLHDKINVLREKSTLKSTDLFYDVYITNDLTKEQRITAKQSNEGPLHPRDKYGNGQSREGAHSNYESRQPFPLNKKIPKIPDNTRTPRFSHSNNMFPPA